MISYLIICRSLTYAQRTARVLQRAGIAAAILRPPVTIPERGCMYGVKIPENRLNAALAALNGAGLGHGRIYALRADGTGDEVRP